jgi:hypothetical protein
LVINDRLRDRLTRRATWVRQPAQNISEFQLQQTPQYRDSFDCQTGLNEPPHAQSDVDPFMHEVDVAIASITSISRSGCLSRNSGNRGGDAKFAGEARARATGGDSSWRYSLQE